MPKPLDMPKSHQIHFDSQIIIIIKKKNISQSLVTSIFILEMHTCTVVLSSVSAIYFYFFIVSSIIILVIKQPLSVYPVFIYFCRLYPFRLLWITRVAGVMFIYFNFGVFSLYFFFFFFIFIFERSMIIFGFRGSIINFFVIESSVIESSVNFVLILEKKGCNIENVSTVTELREENMALFFKKEGKNNIKKIILMTRSFQARRHKVRSIFLFQTRTWI